MRAHRPSRAAMVLMLSISIGQAPACHATTRSSASGACNAGSRHASVTTLSRARHSRACRLQLRCLPGSTAPIIKLLPKVTRISSTESGAPGAIAAHGRLAIERSGASMGWPVERVMRDSLLAVRRRRGQYPGHGCPSLTG